MEETHHATPAEADREALLVLHRSTNGSNWKNKEGWDANSDDLSQWYGVEVNVEGRVEELDLESNNLRGMIPKELGKLAALRKLDLRRNHLSGRVPDALGDLSNLERLSLAFNRLTGTIPEALGGLETLSELHLMGNKLSGCIPEALGGLGKLEELSLGENQLKGSIPKKLGNLGELEQLYLHSNKLSGPIPNELKDLNKLEKLWLHCNKFTGSIPAGLWTLRELKELNLAQNQLTGMIPKGAIEMRKLNKFRVGGNSALSLPPGAAYQRTQFYKWMHRVDDEDLASLRIEDRVVDKHIKGSSQQFPSKEQQGVVLEAPISTKVSDRLEFGDYADVLVERMTDPTAWPVGVGIYAQWGAGKSSLLQLILKKLEIEPKGSEESWLTRWEGCFVRWLWRTTGGAVVYALWAGFKSVVSCRCCCPDARNKETNDADEQLDEAGEQLASAEKGLGPASSPDKPAPPVKSIVASFDAWLYADSKVLWAVLISKIFDEVEDHLGKGAVRAARVRHAVLSSTCAEWCCVIFTAVIVAGVGAAVALAVEQIVNLQEGLAQVAAGAGLAAVPISFLLWMFKVLPVVFKGQGELILEKAQSMGESVGTTQLGFMADVQEELKLLLGMLKQQSTKNRTFMLVVSIDNLDRCPHRQIVKVLEAVHLLLEKDKVNVAVLLALDPRVIIAAIEEDMGEGMRREVSGAEYLDKIIHWPFCIPTGTKTERLTLLRSWLTKGRKKSPSSTRGTDNVNPDQPGGGEGMRSQRGKEVHPIRASVGSSESVPNGVSGSVQPDATPPVDGHKNSLDRKDSSGGASSRENAAASAEKETGAGSPTQVETPAPADTGARAPFAQVGAPDSLDGRVRTDLTAGGTPASKPMRWFTKGGTSPPDTRGTDNVSTHRTDERSPSQGGNGANKEPTTSCQEAQSGSSGSLAALPVRGRTKSQDNEDPSGGAVSGEHSAGSEQQKTDADTATRVEAPDSPDGGGHAPFAGGEAAAPRLQHQPSTSNNVVQTTEEVQELKEMMKRFTPTPRKAKRVYNIYSIQREIARRRAARRAAANHENDDYVFTRDCASKLLRWTILSEFWPFHTACLVAVAMNAEDTGTLYEGTLSSLYETIGADFLSEILNGKQASGGEQESNADVHDAVRTEARRLIGFEEANEDFVRILGFTPYLLVRDLHEDKLGLLRLSFNLNPAMVARVVAWQRSDW